MITIGLADNPAANSNAIADWPLLNALLNTASGASWCRFTTGAALA
ncbi:MAG: hypothetical protein WAL85_04965 [Candidatus Korobacteraceae bacterium]